jgi:hypothetical protein
MWRAEEVPDSGPGKERALPERDDIVCDERVAGSALGDVMHAVASGFRTGDGCRRWGLLRQFTWTRDAQCCLHPRSLQSTLSRGSFHAWVAAGASTRRPDGGDRGAEGDEMAVVDKAHRCC